MKRHRALLCPAVGRSWPLWALLLGIFALLLLIRAGSVAAIGLTGVQPSRGSLSGVVVDGSHAGLTVSNLEIGLVAFTANSSTFAFQERTSSDQTGHFQLGMPPSIKGATYLLATTLNGQPVIQSYQSLASLQAAARSPGGLILTLYATTTRTTSLQATNVILVLANDVPGSLTVAQEWTLANSGHRTVIGPPDRANRHQALAFALTPGYQNLVTQSGVSSGTTWTANNTLYSSTPIPPTSAFGPIIFRYNLPDSATIAVPLPLSFVASYPIKAFLLLLPTGLSITVDGLTRQTIISPFDGKTRVTAYVGQDIAAGQRFVINVGNVTAASSAPTATQEPSDATNLPTNLLIALFLLGFGVVSGAARWYQAHLPQQTTVLAGTGRPGTSVRSSGFGDTHSQAEAREAALSASPPRQLRSNLAQVGDASESAGIDRR